MKKHIILLLLTVLAVSHTVTAANINISVNEETKKVEASVNMGKNEKSVMMTAKITDADGNIDYLTEGYTDENGQWNIDYTTDKYGYFNISAYADGEVLNDNFFIGESIVVEAENIKRKNCSPDIMYDKTISGGAMTAFATKADNTKKYWMEYEFQVDSEGIYELTSRTTPLRVRWTTDYRFKINDGEEYKPSEYAMKSRDFIEYTKDTGLLKEYPLGAFHLNKGTNKLRILLDTDDPTESGLYLFYADCFTFKQSGYEFGKITTTDAAGAYEYGNDVILSIDFTSYAYCAEEYRYTVTDFWNNEKENKNVSINIGERSIAVNLGKYDCGWYRFKLYKDNEEISQTTFAVVPPYAERYSGETPFAADLDTEQLVRTYDNSRKLAKAAKLAGIQWVRERTSQRALKSDENSLPYYKEVNKRAEIMHENRLKVISVLYDFSESDNLIEVYNMQKELAENTATDMWEIDNETDGAPQSGPADIYASFYKAAALGNADSNTDTKISMSSQCMETYTPYNSLFMKNDLMKFSDIYNFHIHTVLSEKETPNINESMIKRHLRASNENGDKPFWITEAGLYIQTDSNSEINDAQRADQAKYNVVSTVQSLAAGTEKHFWFIWPQFIENGREMGTFDKNLNPNPSYQSQAVMTAMLGKAEIKGKLNLTDAEGYVFDSGNGDVAVLWTDNDTTVNLSASDDVTVTDIMGKSQIVEVIGGNAKINIGKYPIYVTYNGTEDYTPISYEKNHEAKETYSPAERIVIKQNFDGFTPAKSRLGYMLEKGKTQNVGLELYNFNSEPQTVKLNGSLCGYDIEFEQAYVTIPAKQSIKVSAQLKPNDTAPEDIRLNLIFSCEADGDVSSPSAAYVIVSDTSKQPDILANGFNNTSRWTNNIGVGGNAVLTETNSGIHFEVTTAKGNRWYYPLLRVNGLGETDGISFTACADKGSDEQGTYNIYVYLSNGKTYYLGGNSGIVLSEKTTKTNISWDEFVPTSYTHGNEDEGIDPALITRIAFGGNFYTDNVGYTLKYLGYYKNVPSSGVTFLSGWAGNDIVKAQIMNNTEDIGEYALAAAVYDNAGKLINIYCKDIEDKAANVPYDVNIQGDMRGNCVKIFAWNGFSQINPHTKNVTAKQEG